MKQKIEINVEPREAGRSRARQMRVNSKIPGVMYGAAKNTPVLVSENDVTKYHTLAHENALIYIKSPSSEINGKVVLFKKVDIHPVTRRPVHIDLLALNLTKEVRVSIEVRVEGKAAGIAEGGIVNIVTRQVEVECLPTEIPEFVTVDVSPLNIGDSLHVSDIKIPDGVKMISRPELTLVSVVEQQEEVVATPAAVDPAAAAAGTPAAGAAAAGTPAAGGAAPAAGGAAPKGGAAGGGAKGGAAGGAPPAKK